MSNTISCKEAFTKSLLSMARKNTNIIALTSDARGSSSLTEYADNMPEQFIEVGIAEQNLVGIASGLASVGKHPYIFAPSCFISSRSLEQIKIDVAYSNQNVKIFGVSGGVSYGTLGYSHHTLYDIALMRAIPNIKIILPTDANQTTSMIEKIENDESPFYIRVGRNAVPYVYENSNSEFIVGKANLLKDGNDLTIVACGEMVWHALKASEYLYKNNIDAAVIDMHTLKPIDEDILYKYAKKTKAIITVEEHNINGGLGAAVSQFLSSNYNVPIINIGFPDEFLVSGSSIELFEHYGLDSKGVVNTAEKILKIKSE